MKKKCLVGRFFVSASVPSVAARARIKASRSSKSTIGTSGGVFAVFTNGSVGLVSNGSVRRRSRHSCDSAGRRATMQLFHLYVVSLALALSFYCQTSLQVAAGQERLLTGLFFQN